MKNTVKQLENTLSPDGLPIETITTGKHWPDLFIAEMKNIMQLHGGSVEEQQGACLFWFPKGTLKRAILPTSSSRHFCIVFPDGFHIMYHQLPQGSDTLAFPMESFSQELQTKYSSL